MSDILSDKQIERLSFLKVYDRKALRAHGLAANAKLEAVLTEARGPMLTAIRAADAIVARIDAEVQDGRLNARSALADLRLAYSDPSDEPLFNRFLAALADDQPASTDDGYRAHRSAEVTLSRCIAEGLYIERLGPHYDPVYRLRTEHVMTQPMGVMLWQQAWSPEQDESSGEAGHPDCPKHGWTEEAHAGSAADCRCAALWRSSGEGQMDDKDASVNSGKQDAVPASPLTSGRRTIGGITMEERHYDDVPTVYTVGPVTRDQLLLALWDIAEGGKEQAESSGEPPAQATPSAMSTMASAQAAEIHSLTAERNRLMVIVERVAQLDCQTGEEGCRCITCASRAAMAESSGEEAQEGSPPSKSGRDGSSIVCRPSPLYPAGADLFVHELIHALDLGDDVKIDQMGNGNMISVPNFIRGFAGSWFANHTEEPPLSPAVAERIAWLLTPAIVWDGLGKTKRQKMIQSILDAAQEPDTTDTEEP